MVDFPWGAGSHGPFRKVRFLARNLHSVWGISIFQQAMVDYQRVNPFEGQEKFKRDMSVHLEVSQKYGI